MEMEPAVDKKLIFTIIFIVFFSLTGCGSSEKKSEIEIAIYNAVDAATANDVDLFLSFIDNDYLDEEERTKSDIRVKVENYLNRFKVISINILNIKTVNKDNENADVIAEINFSHGLGKMISKIIKSTGETYRFSLRMYRSSNGWVVNSAQWDWMSLEELYPESIKVLRDLFPDAF